MCVELRIATRPLSSTIFDRPVISNGCPSVDGAPYFTQTDQMVRDIFRREEIPHVRKPTVDLGWRAHLSREEDPEQLGAPRVRFVTRPATPRNVRFPPVPDVRVSSALAVACVVRAGAPLGGQTCLVGAC
jgi:hypothetical protein